MSTLAELIAGLSHEDGSWQVELPADWMQGRTVYGGLTAALAVGTAQRAVPGLGALRSAQFAFVGPASGVLTLTPTVLRAGRSVTFVSVDAAGPGGLATRVLLCFGSARPSILSHTALPMPAIPEPDACPALTEASDAPRYLAQFDARLAGSGRLGGEGPIADILAWVRHREAVGVDATVALVALGDASPPAPLAMLDRVVPISTILWSVEIGPDPGRGGAGGWRLLHLVGDMIAEGYAAERITVWSEDGEPLMTARQSVAIFE